MSEVEVKERKLKLDKQLERLKRRENRKVLYSRLLSILPIIAVIALWEVVSLMSGGIISKFFPPPSRITEIGGPSLLGGSILVNLLNTLKRAYLSYFLAAALAIPIGLFLGWARFAYRVFEPVLEMLRPIPSLTLIAPAILFLGIGDNAMIFVITYSCFFILIINAIYGVLAVDDVMAFSFMSMNASKFTIFRKLILPSSLPFIFAGLRQATAIALIVAIAVEMIIGQNGIGYYILFTSQSFRYENMYAAIIMTGVTGYVVSRIFIVVERKYLRWAQERMEGQ